MNKKGLVLHWIAFGILAAIGLFFLLTVDVTENVKTKGLWQVSYLRAFQEAELDLLSVDISAKISAKEAADLALDELVSKDLGCGMLDGVSLWNNQDGFCGLRMNDLFLEKFNEMMKNRTGISYHGVYLSDGRIIGIADSEKAITSATDLIPKERRRQGFYQGYNAYLIRPFYLRYQYNPAFDIPESNIFSTFRKLEKEATQLVRACSGNNDLQRCLINNKQANWKFSSCDTESFPGNVERRIIFCIDGLKLGLDFTSAIPLAVENIAASRLQDDTFQITFPQQGVESYNVYFTNYDGLLDYEGRSEDIVVLTSGGNFLHKEEVIEVIACEDVKEGGKAYLCNDEIVYILQSNLIIRGEDYFITVTSVRNEKESKIAGFYS